CWATIGGQPGGSRAGDGRGRGWTGSASTTWPGCWRGRGTGGGRFRP
ncbi:MAG: hypothetical protein AVDCRST_MAG19-4831, partial [uncultured Thermomicrobiales bacterium]